MQVYDFEKHRKIINAELKDRYIKRKENLKKVKETYRNDNYPNENKYCGAHKEVLDLDEIKSKFAYIENKTIGSKNLNSKHIYKSISNKNIDYNKFVNCHFNNIKFENCTFIGNTFNNCVFNNISFSHCNFYDEEEMINEYDLTVFVQEEGDLFRRYCETHYQRAYSSETVRALIEKAGMEVLAIYDAFTYNKPKPDSERVYFVAREHGKKTV